MTDHEMERLVQRFADCVMAQARAIYFGHVSKNDEFGDGYVAAVNQLLTMGDRGRAALSSLFQHEEAQVRVAAAAWLLRSHHTRHVRFLRLRESMRVLWDSRHNRPCFAGIQENGSWIRMTHDSLRVCA